MHRCVFHSSCVHPSFRASFHTWKLYITCRVYNSNSSSIYQIAAKFSSSCWPNSTPSYDMVRYIFPVLNHPNIDPFNVIGRSKNHRMRIGEYPTPQNAGFGFAIMISNLKSRCADGRNHAPLFYPMQHHLPSQVLAICLCEYPQITSHHIGC